MGSCFSKHSRNHALDPAQQQLQHLSAPHASKGDDANVEGCGRSMPPEEVAAQISTHKREFEPPSTSAQSSATLSLSNASSSIFSAECLDSETHHPKQTADAAVALPILKHPPQYKGPALNLPSSPARRRYSYRAEEQEGRFPSSARQQWLSQKAESESTGRRDDKTPTEATDIELGNKNELWNAECARNGAAAERSTSQVAAIALTPRKYSPLTASEAHPQRASSPLKRVQSLKDHGSPRLSKNSSAKTSCSPNRPFTEKHEASLKAHTSQQHYLQKQNSAAADHIPPFPIHRRRNSRELAVSDHVTTPTDLIRGPSPPKKAPVILSSAAEPQINRISVRKPSPTNRDNNMTRQSLYTAADPVAPRKATENSGACGDVNSTAVGLRNVRLLENSPLRRNLSSSSNSSALHVSGTHRGAPRTSADHSLNSDTNHHHHHLKDKDAAAASTRSRRTQGRTPLREMNENVSVYANPQLKGKVSAPVSTKAHDGINATKGGSSIFLDEEEDQRKEEQEDCLAEKLVMSGKSVLSAFKAIEEYKSKQQQQQHSFTLEERYVRLQQPPPQKTPAATQHEILRSSSTKRSGEPFHFPDMQSLLISAGAQEMQQVEGQFTMPASVSKACSILKAVADLNMGSAMYSKDMLDEIEKPKLSSFQFGEGDNDRVIIG